MTSLTQLLLYLKLVWQNRFLVVCSALVLSVLGFYIYHLKTTNTIDELERKTTELEETVERQQRQMKALVESYKKIVKARQELAQDAQKSQQELENLREKLFRENHGKLPLEVIARKKPRLVEKIINNATKETLKCFEILSNGGTC